MREKILEIAEQQMKAGGYSFLSFAQIAKALGTTRANLHYHFKNKETLAVEVTKRFIADHHGGMVKMAEAYAGNFPKYFSVLCEDFLWTNFENHGRVGTCVCAQIIRYPDVPEVLLNLAKKHFENLRKILLEQILSSQEKGIIKKDVAGKVIAAEAGCMLFGLAQMALYVEPHDCGIMKEVAANWVKHYLP